jgi:hypothetical protein
MTQTIEQKSTLYDRDLNLWLEEAIGKNLDFDMSI